MNDTKTGCCCEFSPVSCSCQPLQIFSVKYKGDNYHNRFSCYQYHYGLVRLKPLFHRRNFPQELGTLGWYSVCFHSRNQDINKVQGKNLPLRKWVRNFRWDLGTEHADWLSSRSIVFQPPYIHIIFKILLLLCHEM